MKNSPEDKKRQKHRRIFYLVFLLSFVFPLFSRAQEVNGLLLGYAPRPEGAVDCFDYYRFGSVTAAISSESTTVASGSEIPFTIDIKNENSYPIVDGVVFAKIFRVRGEEKQVQMNGHDVVDQFILTDNINLDANGSKSIQYSWQVPSYSISGKYYLATYFLSSDRFSLSGLSFTDDIIGRSLEFDVLGENTEYVSFDKDQTYINDNQYGFAIFPPILDSIKPAQIKATIVNNTEGNPYISTKWKIYKWDLVREENLLFEDEDSFKIDFGASKEISVLVDDNRYPVYLAVVEFSYRDVKSILNIRFVRNGVNEPRINFSSIGQFPIKKSDKNYVFSCVHNTGTDVVIGDSKIVMTLKDSMDRIFGQFEYIGDITGDMMATKSDFVADKSYDYFKVNTKIFHKDVLVEEVEEVYDCNEINKEKCFFPWSYVYWLIGIIITVYILYRLYNARYKIN